ncbi:hypothetical protein K456DRAFT_1925260 [Colletotrichum gloeosporioides 23]|nr:hypothetical protein K456DRAFT_1925260 [Colletotrichum gloeosporioides 23]
MKKRLQVLLGPSAAVTAACPAHVLSLANNAVVAAGSDLSQGATFSAFWHDFGLTFVTRRKFTMLCFPWRAPPRLQKHPTPNSTPDDQPPTPPPGMPPGACARPCGLGGACHRSWHTHTHRPGAPVTASAPAAGLCHPFPTSHRQQTHRAKTCPAAYRRLPEDEAAPRQLKLAPRHRERIPRGSNGAIHPPKPKPSGCSCLIWATVFVFSLPGFPSTRTHTNANALKSRRSIPA